MNKFMVSDRVVYYSDGGRERCFVQKVDGDFLTLRQADFFRCSEITAHYKQCRRLKKKNPVYGYSKTDFSSSSYTPVTLRPEELLSFFKDSPDFVYKWKLVGKRK